MKCRKKIGKSGAWNGKNKQDGAFFRRVSVRNMLDLLQDI